MKLEVGKCYRTRSGCKVGPMRAVGETSHGFVGALHRNGIATDHFFRAGGRFGTGLGGTTDLDLVAPWPMDGEMFGTADYDSGVFG